MKLSILRNELVSALATVLGVIDRAQTMQVLSHVLIDASGEQLCIAGSNLEIELRTNAAAQIEIPGRATVHAKKLYDIARNLPEGAEIKLGFEHDKVILKSGRSRYVLPALLADEMPLMDDRPLNRCSTFKIAERDLKRLMQSVAFVVADNDPRPYLNGMLLHLIGDKLHAVGSDGISIGHATVTLAEKATEGVQAILHSRSIKEIQRLLADSDELATIRVSRAMAELQLAACKVTTKTIDQGYVAYERVMGFETKSELKVDRDALRGALARSAIVMSTTSKVLRLKMQAGGLELAANSSAVEAGTEHLDAEFSGDDGFEIAFAVDQLTDVTAALPSGPMLMQIDSPHNPARILSASNDACKYVVMPFKI